MTYQVPRYYSISKNKRQRTPHFLSSFRDQPMLYGWVRWLKSNVHATMMETRPRRSWAAGLVKHRSRMGSLIYSLSRMPPISCLHVVYVCHDNLVQQYHGMSYCCCVWVTAKLESTKSLCRYYNQIISSSSEKHTHGYKLENERHQQPYQKKCR